MQTTGIGGRTRATEDGDYQELLAHLRYALAQSANSGGFRGPLFTTDAEDLYDLFLAELPAKSRKRYVCRACKKFVNKVGSVVSIDETGSVASPFWHGWEVPAFFANAISVVASRLQRARVTGVYLNAEPVWGIEGNQSRKGYWSHMHCSAGICQLKSTLLTAEQAMAEKAADYETLSRALGEYPLELVRKAHTLLTTGGLFRSEKHVGTAKWLLDLHEALEGAGAKHRKDHLVWRAVATAPPGFCHVKSTMIGTLLDDIASGKSFEAIKAEFNAKMNPGVYQRPQAAPKAGQLAAAEKVVEKLASAGSLERRFARLEDIADDAIWLAEAARSFRKRPATTGVFGHLHPKIRTQRVMDAGRQTMTWDKFWRTVLPEAEAIECFVPPGRAAFFAFTTAVNESSPPLLQWDRDDARNPVAWYLYLQGSLPFQWGLTPGSWVNVTAVTTQPSSWGGGSEHQGNGAYFVLEGARDRSHSGLALFPETLRSEYHAIRSSIEAYSRSRRLLDVDEASACGLAAQKSNTGWDVRLRVTSKGTRVEYKLDRWD